MGGTLCKIGSPLLSFLLCSLCTPLQEFFKKKWRREHISTIIACTVAWIVLMAALIIQNVEVYLCGTIGSLLAIIYYRVLNNRMLAYVEDHIYGGK